MLRNLLEGYLDSSQVLMEMLGNHVQESEQDKKKVAVKIISGTVCLGQYY